jgi:hypothetical protein
MKVANILSNEEVIDTFVNTHLEGNYDFLQEDLVKLANAFIAKAKPAIQKEERDFCVDIARSVNHLVADKIASVRRQM